MDVTGRLAVGGSSSTTRDDDVAPFAERPRGGTDCGVVGGLVAFDRGHNDRATTYSDESHVR